MKPLKMFSIRGISWVKWRKRFFPAESTYIVSSISENLRETKAALRSRKPLFEAGFSANHLFCRVDVLNPAGESGWDIIEVKSTTEIRDEHLHDVAFQRHCCKLAGAGNRALPNHVSQ